MQVYKHLCTPTHFLHHIKPSNLKIGDEFKKNFNYL